MRKFQHLLLVVALIILGTTSALAVPAYPSPIEVTQPDGTKITIILKGDEKIKWAQTLDGYTILFNKEGNYEYAIKNEKGDLTLSGIKARMPEHQSFDEKVLLANLEKGLFYSKSQVEIMHSIWGIKDKEGEKAFPTTGNRSLICILVGFTDKAFTKTQAEFNNLFNQVGYTTGGATGSVKDYYLENSYNQFNLTVDVAGPYTLAQNMAYYGNNTNGNARAMVSEAINLANPDVNFANYDNDNDGYVDGVYIIFAGYGEEAGGGDDAIWSHAWNISSVQLDGKWISKYSCSPELRGNSGTNLTRIGVICHEFGHVLGAPDYYDTDGESGGSFSGTGNWDMMAGGSWNNGGATPAHHNAYTKVYKYGWASATILSAPTIITLDNSSENSTSFYRYNTSTNNEYFLVENRHKHKFDSYIPGSGMIIYHVHSGVNSVGNSINATHPQRMYPVSANATIDPTATPSSYGTINSSTCAWPTATKTSFTDETLPSSKSWAGANTAKPITNITKNTTAKTVSFYFMGGVMNWPTNFIATPLDNSQINLTWNKTEEKDVLIAYSSTGTFGTPSTINYTVGNSISGGGTVIYTGGDESFSHLNLIPSTSYYYRIWSKLSTTPTWSIYQSASATTFCDKYDSFPFNEIFDGSITPSCWFITTTVADKTWKTTTGYTINASTSVAPKVGSHFMYCPWSLFDTQNELLEMPPFDFSTMESPYFSFWFNGDYNRSIVTDVCDLNLLISISGGSWEEIWNESNYVGFTSISESYKWLKTIIDLSAYAGESNVRIAFQYIGVAGSNFAIDCVALQEGMPVNAENVIEINNNLKISPNPFFNRIKIEADFTVESVAVLNSAGQVVTSFSAINSKEELFNLSNLQSGPYIISITGKNGQKANRMVVKQ